jgi:hypothetical protein
MAFLEEIKKYDCEKIAIMVATPYTKCIEQNGQRDRQVPEHVIRKMYLNIFIPQYYEGWDKIHIIYNSYDYIADAGELFYGDNGLDYIDQETPYHTLTIGEHCKKCFTLCKELTNDFDLLTASLYHDIGKRFVKEYNEEKGYYVYYQHHLVSAYDSMFYLSPLNDKRTLTVVGYITWHMQLHFTLSAKSTQKFINLVGKEFYDNLLILHQADINAK